MSCEQFAALQHDLLDGRLPDATAREAAAHAEACTACGAQLAEHHRLRQALQSLASDALPASLRARVMGALLADAARTAPPPEIMTLPEVAAYLRLPETGVRAALGSLPHFAVAGELRFRRASLEAWIEREESRRSGAAVAGPVLTLLTADVVPGLLAGQTLGKG